MTKEYNLQSIPILYVWIVDKLELDLCYKLLFFLKLHPQCQAQSTPTLETTIF